MRGQGNNNDYTAQAPTERNRAGWMQGIRRTNVGCLTQRPKLMKSSHLLLEATMPALKWTLELISKKFKQKEGSENEKRS